MKVLLFNGSPRPNGCTYTALCEVAGALRQDGCRLRLSLGVAEDGILDVKRLEIAQRHEILSCKSTSARPSAA